MEKHQAKKLYDHLKKKCSWIKIADYRNGKFGLIGTYKNGVDFHFNDYLTMTFRSENVD